MHRSIRNAEEFRLLVDNPIPFSNITHGNIGITVPVTILYQHCRNAIYFIPCKDAFRDYSRCKSHSRFEKNEKKKIPGLQTDIFLSFHVFLEDFMTEPALEHRVRQKNYYIKTSFPKNTANIIFC